MIVSGTQIRVEGSLPRIARLEAEKYHFVEDPSEIIGELRGCNRRIDLFTFMQRLPEVSPKYSYPMEWDNFAAIRVTTFEHWWSEQIGFKARNKAKQAAKKGVIVEEVPFSEQLVKGIWEIYNECPVRQGRRFTHFGKDVQTVYREEATFLESSVFIGAFLDGKLIGFVKLVHDETRVQAGLMNIVSMISQRDRAPTNALVAQAVRSCAERGISYLVYSNFAYGDKQQSTISDFKERNGFERINLPRYYVPLTTIGAAALRMGLHHRFAELIPNAVATRLRELRGAWYNRKLQSAVDSY